LIVTAGAVSGLERCRAFLNDRNPAAAVRAAGVIGERFASLATAPRQGRPFAPSIDLRELIIPFGDTGYVALYRHEPAEDAIHILAFRHQREAGY